MKARNSDPFFLALYIKQEAEELIEALQRKDKTIEDAHKDVTQEAIDVYFLFLALTSVLGIDIDAEFREKLGFNMARHIAQNYNGDLPYDKARALSKQQEKAMRLKEQFYNEI